MYAMHMLFANVYLDLTSVRACVFFYYVSVFVNVCILF